MPAFPDIPTLSAESGLPGYEFETWFGLFVPSAVPELVRARLERARLAALKLKTFNEQLLVGGGADSASVGRSPPSATGRSNAGPRWSREGKLAPVGHLDLSERPRQVRRPGGACRSEESAAGSSRSPTGLRSTSRSVQQCTHAAPQRRCMAHRLPAGTAVAAVLRLANRLRAASAAARRCSPAIMARSRGGT